MVKRIIEPDIVKEIALKELSKMNPDSKFEISTEPQLVLRSGNKEIKLSSEDSKKYTETYNRAEDFKKEIINLLVGLFLGFFIVSLFDFLKEVFIFSLKIQIIITLIFFVLTALFIYLYFLHYKNIIYPMKLVEKNYTFGKNKKLTEGFQGEK